MEWKTSVLNRVDNKIIQLRKGTLRKWRSVKQMLRDSQSLNELKLLQENFVIVPVDKASNNLSLICKKYYIKTIQKELNSTTYRKAETLDTTINNQVTKCLDLGSTIHSDNRKLPIMYAIPKMHKNPVKFRFIVAANKCLSKDIAKTVTKILKLFMAIHRKYCDKIKAYTRIERMWITESTKDILDDVHHLNIKKRSKSVNTFDFSTLYTKINLEDLKDKLDWITDKAFKGGTNQYIRILRDSAKFDNIDRQNGRYSGRVYTKDKCKEMIHFIIDNAYFSVADQCYQQIIGIPMGTAPTPFIDNYTPVT